MDILAYIDKLQGSINYSKWAFAMKLVLKHENLWHVVKNGTPLADDPRQDERALALICLAVSPGLYADVENCSTAQEAWQILARYYGVANLSNRLAVLQKLFRINLADFENMDAYIGTILSLAQELTELKRPLDDELVAIIMLSGLTSDYDQIVIELENTSTALSTNIVKNRLFQDDKRQIHNNINIAETEVSGPSRKQLGKRQTLLNGPELGACHSSPDEKPEWMALQEGHIQTQPRKHYNPATEVGANSSKCSDQPQKLLNDHELGADTPENNKLIKEKKKKDPECLALQEDKVHAQPIGVDVDVSAHSSSRLRQEQASYCASGYDESSESVPWTYEMWTLTCNTFKPRIPTNRPYDELNKAHLAFLAMYCGAVPFNMEKYVLICNLILQYHTSESLNMPQYIASRIVEGENDEPILESDVVGEITSIEMPELDVAARLYTVPLILPDSMEIANALIHDITQNARNEMTVYEYDTYIEKNETAKKTVLLLMLETWMLMTVDEPMVLAHFFSYRSFHSKLKLFLPANSFLNAVKGDMIPANEVVFPFIVSLGLIRSNQVIWDKIKSFIKISCWTPLVADGLGLITWTSLASNKMEIPVERLLEIAAECIDDEQAVRRVRSYYKKTPHPSHYICRLLNPAAMAEYSTESNLLWCAMCASIVMGIIDSVHVIPDFSRSDPQVLKEAMEKALLIAPHRFGDATGRDKTSNIQVQSGAEQLQLRSDSTEQPRYRSKMKDPNQSSSSARLNVMDFTVDHLIAYVYIPSLLKRPKNTSK